MRTPIQRALNPEIGDVWKWIKHKDTPLPADVDRFGPHRTILKIEERSDREPIFYITRNIGGSVAKHRSFLQEYYTPVLPEDFIECLASLRLIMILINYDLKDESFELLTEIGA